LRLLIQHQQRRKVDVAKLAPALVLEAQ